MVNESQVQVVGRAFSKINPETYNIFSKNSVRRWARFTVYQHILKYLKKSDKILDIAAGTGFDAVYFVKKGHRVHAIDISDGMLIEIARKIELHVIDNALTFQKLSYSNLADISETGFDYVMSNFGGLNCVRDLREVTRTLPMIMKKMGFVTFIIMPPLCPWEIISFPRNPRVALRRLASLRSMTTKAKIENEIFDVRYFTPKQIEKSFGSKFRKVDQQSLCNFVPPLFTDQNNFGERYSGFIKFLKKFDYYTSRTFPFNSMGDFVIVTMQYTG